MAYEYQNFATLGVNLNRQKYGSLDVSQVFNSQGDLDYYVSKGSNTANVSSYWANIVPYPYAGQYLALVKPDNSVTAYILEENESSTFSCKEVGKSSIGDENTIVVAEDGTISLAGVSGLEFTDEDDNTIVYQPLLVNGILTWVIPSTTTVEGLSTEIEALRGRLSAAEAGLASVAEDLEDVYTKSQTDSKIATEIAKQKHFSAQVVISVDQMTDPNTLYLKKIDAVTGPDTYEEYILVNSVPTLIGDTSIDLSDYATKTEVETSVSVATATLSEHQSEQDLAIQALQTNDTDTRTRVSNLESVNSERNIVNGVSTEFTISDRILAINSVSPDKITGLSAQLAGITETLADKVDKELGSRLLTSEESRKLSALILNDNNTVEVSGSIDADNVTGLNEWISENKNTVSGLVNETLNTKISSVEFGAQENKLEIVKVAGSALTINSKAVNVPIAGGTRYGVVIGSSSENNISIDDIDGTMTVNSINVNKLVQNSNDTLIIHGGTAQ